MLLCFPFLLPHRIPGACAWAPLKNKNKAAPPLGCCKKCKDAPLKIWTSPRVAKDRWSHPGPLVTSPGDSQAPWVVFSCVSVSHRMSNIFGKILSHKFLFRCVLACLGFLVFHHPIDNEVFDTTLSNPSCFTNGTFGVCKLLGENFGIEYGTMTTIHSYNGDNMILDGCHSDLLRDRCWSYEHRAELHRSHGSLRSPAALVGGRVEGYRSPCSYSQCGRHRLGCKDPHEDQRAGRYER